MVLSCVLFKVKARLFCSSFFKLVSTENEEFGFLLSQHPPSWPGCTCSTVVRYCSLCVSFSSLRALWHCCSQEVGSLYICRIAVMLLRHCAELTKHVASCKVRNSVGHFHLWLSVREEVEGFVGSVFCASLSLLEWLCDPFAAFPVKVLDNSEMPCWYCRAILRETGETAGTERYCLKLSLSNFCKRLCLPNKL